MVKEELEAEECYKPGEYNGHGKKFVVMFLMAILIAGVTAGVFFYLTKSDAKQNIYVSSNVEQNKISVSGDAQKTVAPDLAVIFVGAETEEKTAKDAQANNAVIMDKIKKALKDNGIKDEDVKTYSFSTQPVTEGSYVCPTSKPNCDTDEEIWKTEVVGYQTAHLLKVESEDLAKIGDVVDAAVDAGANNLNSVSFTLKDETRKQIKQELLAQAVADAKAKAEKMAGEARIKLLKPIAISESYSYYPSNYYYESKAIMASAEGLSTSISQGTIDVSASVAVVYESAPLIAIYE